MENYAYYEPLIGDLPAKTFLVTDDKKDDWGYPKVSTDMPEVYNILWQHFNHFFNPEQNYWWTQDQNTVLNVISDMWKVADFKKRFEADHE